MQRKNGRRKKIAYVLCGILAVVLFSGCQSTAADGTDEKVFVYGDTTFNAENDESDVNPHNGYSGWACIRYGIGETLFHYSDSMEIEPWLAESYELVDDTTWRITLHEGISFTSGRTLDAEAVKECLEDLIAVHDRARGDLKIESIEADGLIVTIHTEQPVPALLNYLSDPYGCIIDMQAGVTDDGNVAGTGPYRAVQVETDQGLTLMKNDNYWNGTPKLDRIEVKTIRDGDTMTMALQSGELDAAYGLPYSNLILFRDEPYTISSADTSRTFFGQFNGSSEVLQDDRVREAVIGAIDREGFVNTLMEGNGSVAEGPFPSYFAFGDSKVQEESYDLEYSRELLAEAGWTDETATATWKKTETPDHLLAHVSEPPGTAASRGECTGIAEENRNRSTDPVHGKSSGTAEKRKLGCLCQRICQRTDGRSRVFLYNALPAGFLQEPRRLLQ